jgi:hypothetical protein
MLLARFGRRNPALRLFRETDQRATNFMLVVSGSTIRSTCGWLATRTMRAFARQSICRTSRRDARTRHHQNKSGGSLCNAALSTYLPALQSLNG